MMMPLVAAFCLLSLGACDQAMAPASPDLDAGLPEQPAVATCMSSVAQRTPRGIIAPTKVSSVPSGTNVSLGVGESRALWKCRVDRGGAVVAVGPVATA